jgi:hypothetical protein
MRSVICRVVIAGQVHGRTGSTDFGPGASSRIGPRALADRRQGQHETACRTGAANGAAMFTCCRRYPDQVVQRRHIRLVDPARFTVRTPRPYERADASPAPAYPAQTATGCRLSSQCFTRYPRFNGPPIVRTR